MATLANNTIASTYPLLLKISDTGLNASLKAIEDGDGTSSALMVSTEGIAVETSGLQVHIDSGSPIYGVQIETAASDGAGWSRSYNFGKQSDNTKLTGFGGYGTAEALTYNWIGTEYNDCNMRIRKDSQVNFINADVSITGTNKLYFGATSSTTTDTVGDTYITEGSANKLKIYAGGVNCATFEDDSIELGTSQLSLTSDSGAEIYFSGTGNAANIIGEQSMGLRAGYGSSDSSHVITFGTAGVDGQIVMRSGNLRFAQASYIEPEATAHNAVGLGLTIAGGNPTAGTTDNIAGGSLTIAGGQGKGTGAGGDIIFQVANAGGSGSSLNSLATAMTISDDTNITMAGGLTVVGDLDLQGGDITTDAGDIVIKSNGNLTFLLDDDNDETSQSFAFYNDTTEVANLDESGNLQIDGSLTVGSNIIKASDGGSTITMDTSDNVIIAGSLSVGGPFLIMPNGGLIAPDNTAHNVAGASMLISAGDTTAGDTNDIAGGTLTIEAGKGKGTGVGGDILFKVATPAVGTASTMNSLATVLTISGTTGNVSATGYVSAENFGAASYHNKASTDLLISSTQDVIIRVDDDQGVGAGAQKFKVKNGADNVVSEMNESGDLTIQGTFLENRTTIKIPPTAFTSNEGGTADINYAVIDDSSSVKGLRVSSPDCELYAYIDVPTGYTATKVRINGSDDAMDIEVYTLDLDAGTISAEISNSGLQTNDDTALASNHVGADDKMLFIKVVTTATDDIIWGGYVTIQQT